MSVQSLTLQGCFHVHLLKVESFSALIEKPILMGGPTRFVTSLMVWKPILDQYSTWKSVMWKLEASGEQTLRMDFKVKGNTCCPAVQLIFIDSGFLMKEVISKVLMRLLIFFVERTYQIPIIIQSRAMKWTVYLWIQFLLSRYAMPAAASTEKRTSCFVFNSSFFFLRKDKKSPPDRHSEGHTNTAE